jgi:hypothetical protein
VPKLLPSVTLAIAAAIVFPAAASAGGVRLPFSLNPSLGGVTKLSPAVTVQDVGKEVIPGVFQVDPRAIKGKRLVLAGSDPNAGIAVCIGSLSKLGTCIGVYIDTKAS